MTQNMDRDERDEIDALLARLEQAEPPGDFVARVMARARQGEVARWAAWQRAAFGVLYALALIGLGVLAYLTGVELGHSHARELISVALQDLSAVKDSPGIYLTAIEEAMPWRVLLATIGDLALLAVATRLVVRVATPPAGGRHAVPV
jgi:predicted anti-sigma-YlaC factor YlaD